ncbi:MAG: (d)CMP kinase [Saprospiraceae bacterium]|nr:(d)CMP kinase [Saprospiraceae bacterium]
MENHKKYRAIAIDGVSSSGKSTMAKRLAKTLGYTYIDTGAMYRAVTWFFLEKHVNIEDEQEVSVTLDKINISFRLIEGKNVCFINGQNAEPFIRSMEVSNFVSQVAAISSVRKKMVFLQQEIGKTTHVVMDGRDIGTVVFPDADVKIFVNSPARLRAERRWLEMKETNPDITVDEIENNLNMRDYIDSTREDSPLKQAEDALLIDNTLLNVEEQYKAALDYIHQKL